MATALLIEAKGAPCAWDERLAHGDRNAFDAIRLVLASMVALAHSYFLIDNSARRDPLFVISGGQTNCGQFAVVMFFALSGFLVTHSAVRSGIVPGFLVASLIGCLVVGPLTAPNVLGFFQAQNWRAIVLSALALKQVGVSGVLDGNALQLVHGTLWTIKYEFDCYLLVALLAACGLLRPGRRLVAFAGLALMLAGAAVLHPPVIDHGVLALLISSPDKWADMFPFFFVGSAFYLWRDRIPKSPTLLAVSITAVVASFWLGGAFWALLLGGTYVALYVALSVAAEIRLLGRRVDLSYGVYLYGWPIQQLLLFYSGQKLGPLSLFAATLILTFAVAWLSWVYVEQPWLDRVRRAPAGQR